MINIFFGATCPSKGGGLIDPSKIPQTCADQNTLNTILSIAFVIIGAVAVLVIIIAGFRLVISGGQPEKVAEAKKQIGYALVGLVVAAMAAVIVNAVLGRG